MNQLVIIGASAMGRETCAYAQECGMKVKGFLDSRTTILDKYEGYPPILGAVESWRPSDDEAYICACGEPQVKRKYVEMFPNVKWVTIVHPTAYVGPNVSIGHGTIICPRVTITTDTKIGNHVIVNVNVSISHDCFVGDHTTISPGCHVAGWCSIGASSFLGVHSAMVPHITLGEHVFVAAGAVVVKSVKSGRVMGVPAKPK